MTIDIQSEKDKFNSFIKAFKISKPLLWEPSWNDSKSSIQCTKNKDSTGIVLRDYQKVGVEWLAKMYANGLGCLLADEMGLGKTCQTIQFLSYFFKFITKKSMGTSQLPLALIVVPLCVLDNWKEEWLKFSFSNLDSTSTHHPQANNQIINGLFLLHGTKVERYEQIKSLQNTKPLVILTTFEVVNSEIELLKKMEFQILVVDEAHRLKNIQSLTHLNLCNLNTSNRILLTGTPIQNNIFELFALLKFSNPHIFEMDSDTFAEWYYEDVDGIKRLLSFFMLRRNKESVIQLPPVKQSVIYTDGIPSTIQRAFNMTKLQKNLYKSILLKDISSVVGQKKTGLLNILMQLRKCVNHPYLFDGVEPEPFSAGEHLIHVSGKMIVLDKILNFVQKRGMKVLLFSQMTHMLDILQDYLNYRNMSYERLDGSIRSQERNLSIDNFQNQDTFVFLLSTRAGGVGLNLTAANVVIFFDSDFNPMQDKQAAARTHRIGQQKPVFVIRLVTKNAFEELCFKRSSRRLILSQSLMMRTSTDSIDKMTNKNMEDNKDEVNDSSEPKIEQSSSEELISIVRFGLSQFSTESENDSPSDSNVSSIDHDGITKMKSQKYQIDTVFDLDERQLESLFVIKQDIPFSSSSHDNNAFAASSAVLEKNKSELGADTSTMETRVKQETITLEELIKKEENEDEDENMYVYEGKDYKRDADVLDRMINEKKEQQLLSSVKRRASKEDLDERIKGLEERRKQQQEFVKKRKRGRWQRHGYISRRINIMKENLTTEQLSIESDISQAKDEKVKSEPVDRKSNEVEIESKEKEYLRFITGDVTRPIVSDSLYSVIIHIVDNSGKWPNKGVFAAIRHLDQTVPEYYAKASEMQDLEQGSCHMLPVSSNSFVALIVAQKRDRQGIVSGLLFEGLESGLNDICWFAKRIHASVHLPRIGQGTHYFDWYRTERLIRKCLSCHQVPTMIYYYKRQ